MTTGGNTQASILIGPDTRQWQTLFDKLGVGFAKQMANVGRAAAGGVDRDKAGDPKQNVGQQLGKLARMMPGGSMLADVGKAFKQGGMMTGMMAGLVSIVGFFKSALSQSKIFTTVAQTFMKIVGVMLDMMLMPLLPYFMRFLQWWMSAGIKFAQETGKFIKSLVDIAIPILGFTKTVVNALLPFGTISTWFKPFMITWFAAWAASKLLGGLNRITGGRSNAMLLRGGSRMLGGVKRQGGRLLGRGAATQVGVRGITQVNSAALLQRSRSLQPVGRAGGGFMSRVGSRAGLGVIGKVLGRTLGGRGGAMLAGAALGGGVGLAAGGLPAIPGALIGAVAGLVIGQAAGVAVDAATGRGFDAKRAIIPLYAETEDIYTGFFKSQSNILDENNKKVRAVASRTNQEIQREVEESYQETWGGSYVPETVDAYMSVYEKMAGESELNLQVTETDSKGIISSITEFMNSIPGKIFEAMNVAWDTIEEWYNTVKETAETWYNAILSFFSDQESDLANRTGRFAPGELFGDVYEITDINKKEQVYTNPDVDANAAITNARPGQEEIYNEYVASGYDRTVLDNYFREQNPDRDDAGITGDVFDFERWFSSGASWNRETDSPEGRGEGTFTQPSTLVSGTPLPYSGNSSAARRAEYEATTAASWNAMLDPTIGVDDLKSVQGSNLDPFNTDALIAAGEVQEANRGGSVEDIENLANATLQGIEDILKPLYMDTNQNVMNPTDEIVNAINQGQIVSGFSDKGTEAQAVNNYETTKQIEALTDISRQEGLYGEFGKEVNQTVLDQVAATVGQSQQTDLDAVELNLSEFASAGLGLDELKGWGPGASGTPGLESQFKEPVLSQLELQALKEEARLRVIAENKAKEDAQKLDPSLFVTGAVSTSTAEDPLADVYQSQTGLYVEKDPALKAIYDQGPPDPPFDLPKAPKGSKQAAMDAKVLAQEQADAQKVLDDAAKAEDDLRIANEAAAEAQRVANEQAQQQEAQRKQAEIRAANEAAAKAKSAKDAQAAADLQDYQEQQQQASLWAAQQQAAQKEAADAAKVIADAQAASQAAAATKQANSAAAAQAAQDEQDMLEQQSSQYVKKTPTTKTTTGQDVYSYSNLYADYVYHQGGVVPGPKGSEQSVLAMAGETVLPTHLGSSWMDSTKGGSALQRQMGDNMGGNTNIMNKPTTINIYTSEDAAATIANIERMQMMDEASLFTAM